MESTPRETAEESVLLSWEMPRWKEQVLGASGLLIAVSAGALAFLALSVFAAAIVIAGIGMAWVSFVGKMAVGFRCMNPGIELRLLSRRSARIPWEDVYKLRRRTSLMQLDTPKTFFLLPGVPVPVADQLIAILHEASNARIIGFGADGD